MLAVNELNHNQHGTKILQFTKLLAAKMTNVYEFASVISHKFLVLRYVPLHTVVAGLQQTSGQCDQIVSFYFINTRRFKLYLWGVLSLMTPALLIQFPY